jgi:hypothetical protein
MSTYVHIHRQVRSSFVLQRFSYIYMYTYIRGKSAVALYCRVLVVYVSYWFNLFVLLHTPLSCSMEEREGEM